MANNVPPVYGINQYLWAQLGPNGPSDRKVFGDDYGTLVPIIPLGEAPQFLQAIDEKPGISSLPYIVYTWYTNGYNCDAWYKPTDTVIYTIYAPSVGKVNQIVLGLTDLLKRYDLSAESVNHFIQTYTNSLTGNPLPDEYKAYNYSYISVASATGGVAPNEENAPIAATVVLRVNYTNPTVDNPLP